MLSVLKAVSCAFFLSFLSNSSSKISLVFLWVLLEGEVLSNKIEARILTLLLLVRAKKILVFSHHPFHSFLSLTEKTSCVSLIN